MKVIFLDIDGVLNTEVWTRHVFKIIGDKTDTYKSQWYRDEYGHIFDSMAVDMLEWLIEATGAKIVISSTWRMSGLRVMQTMWEMRDLPGEVIDITPKLNTPRGEEIAEWLRENQVDSYVIIDDDADMLPEQLSNFVQTDCQYGLTLQKALDCVNILNKP